MAYRGIRDSSFKESAACCIHCLEVSVQFFFLLILSLSELFYYIRDSRELERDLEMEESFRKSFERGAFQDHFRLYFNLFIYLTILRQELLKTLCRFF